MYEFDKEAYRKRTAWFTEARFGFYIHWGIYAIPGRQNSEWIRSIEQIPAEEYEPFAKEFTAEHYNPKKWARMAKDAGMKYAVMITKHHDGFCLFDSKLTDFKAPEYCGRDLIREFVDAFRAEGLRVGLYYSIIDWHHPDFMHKADIYHPDRSRPDVTDEGRDFNRYLAYMHGQVRELMTNYGKIDVLWLDYSYPNPAGTDMIGETWEATKLVRMVRELQPEIMLDNRLECGGHGFGSLMTAHPNEFSGDFVSPEQIVPPNGLFNELGERVVWESGVTINNNWGYCQLDKNFKPADMVVKKLVECVSKGGNLLLNFGPDRRGDIPEECEQILAEVGRWMRRNGESIHGCGCAELEKPEYGRITRNGNKLYYHVMESQITYVYLPGVSRSQIKKLRLLRDGTELKIVEDWITTNYPELVFVSLGASPVLPDPIDTVIEVELLEA